MGPKRNLSQPSSTSRAQSSRITSSQPNIDVSFRNMTLTSETLNDRVNDCVRYMIYKSGQQLPFRKNDLQKQIKGVTGRAFDQVIERASALMERVYGYKIILCDGSTKFYILSNNLPHIEGLEEEEPDELPEDSKKIVLMLVLTHLFMSPSVVTQASLYSFLKALHIDPDRRHEVFGTVKDYLNVTWVRQHYLNIEKDSITQELSFSWGPRAEKEISKHDLLKFVCKIYKDVAPKSWLTQYNRAEEQSLENHRNRGEDSDDEAENE